MQWVVCRSDEEVKRAKENRERRAKRKEREVREGERYEGTRKDTRVHQPRQVRTPYRVRSGRIGIGTCTTLLYHTALHYSTASTVQDQGWCHYHGPLSTASTTISRNPGWIISCAPRRRRPGEPSVFSMCCSSINAHRPFIHSVIHPSMPPCLHSFVPPVSKEGEPLS